MKMINALIVLMFLTLSACGGEEGPPPECAVKSTTDMGVLEQAATIRGRDGGYPGLFAGKSVWLYGDTMLDVENEIGSKWLNNSWSWTEDQNAADGITGFVERTDAAGAPTEFYPQTPVEEEFNDAHRGDPCQVEPCGARWALWPAAFVADPDRNRALVFYHKIYGEPGEWNFYGVGSSIAVWNNFEDLPERPVVNPGAEHPTLLFNQDEPAFGDAALLVEDMLYAYACETDWVAKPCVLGRVPVDQALERDAWRFHSGADNWVEDFNEAQVLFDGNDIVSVAYNRYLQCYLAVYSAPMDNRAMLRTAPRPEGPWSAPLPVFEAQKPENDNGWVYDALPHPELERDNGRIQYVTYSRATGFFLSEVRTVEVELE